MRNQPFFKAGFFMIHFSCLIPDIFVCITPIVDSQ